MLTIRQAHTNNFFITTLERKFLLEFCEKNRIEICREFIDSDELQEDKPTGVFCCYGIDKVKDYVLSIGGVWLIAK